MPVRALPPGAGEIYKQLEDSQHGLNVEVQAVSHPSFDAFCHHLATHLT
jgi:hypothetical protein